MSQGWVRFASGPCRLALALFIAAPAWSETVPPEAVAADVIFLGEQHDNPAHHARQADWVARLDPLALVFEMLTEEQASHVTPEARENAEKLEAALGWEAAGWPDFAMYFPIFAAAPQAAIYGAGVPVERARALRSTSILAAEPLLSERFLLNEPLPEDQQATREGLQALAHCNALPEDMLGYMVSVQRLRDAALADAALRALQDTGGPVVVITGNGHAREDWGAPFLMRRAAPGVSVFALGQGEAGETPGGAFSTVADAPTVDRGDPCAAFTK